jgi:hypothetical protein
VKEASGISRKDAIHDQVDGNACRLPGNEPDRFADQLVYRHYLRPSGSRALDRRRSTGGAGLADTPGPPKSLAMSSSAAMRFSVAG